MYYMNISFGYCGMQNVIVDPNSIKLHLNDRNEKCICFDIKHKVSDKWILR